MAGGSGERTPKGAPYSPPTVRRFEPQVWGVGGGWKGGWEGYLRERFLSELAILTSRKLNFLLEYER